MTRFSFLVLLSFVFHFSWRPYLHAQDISGYWQGVLYQDFPSGTVYHPLSMHLTQNGSDVSGTSEILWSTDPTYYGIMSLGGTFDGSIFTFQEWVILDQNPHPSASWCIKNGDLMYSDVNQVLKGPWQAPSCYPGTIELHRLTLLSDTIFCKNDSVQIHVTGINIRWYSDPELTHFLDTGNIFYPGIIDTDTFYVTQTHYFTESPPFPIQIIISAPKLDSLFIEPTGCGAPDGSVVLFVSGGIPDYQFALDGSPYQSNPIFSGLESGLHTISILDAHGCDADAQFQVLSAIPPKIDSMNIPIIPCGMDTTSIQVFASGGTGDLVYQLNYGSFQKESKFYGLTCGIYRIIVKDEKQCEDTITFFIDSLQPPIITGVIGIFPICKAANGSLSIQVTGGNGTLSYSLSGSTFQVSNDFENLAAGLYEIHVSDSMGCLAKELFELEAIGNLITIQTVVTPSECGQANGALSIQAQGTTDSLTFTLGSLPEQGIPVFLYLMPGTYPLLITDGNGCIGVDTILIPDLPEPTILVEAIRHTRCGLSNGEIEIAVIHSLPFVYTLNGGSTQLNGFFKDLDPGVYEVRVTDSIGCSSQVEVTIETSSNPEFTQLNLEATTCGNVNGAIKMVVHGGRPPYSYTLNGGAYQDSGTFEYLAAGDYSISVLDMEGCVTDTVVFVPYSVGIQTGSITIIDADCESATGHIEVFATGGTGTLFYALDLGPEQLEGTFSNLAKGTYSLVIRDEMGCKLMVDNIVNEWPCNFFIPNSFSPNGDGINDEFRIYGPDPGIAVITRYAIFDRWGNMLYEQKNLVMDTQEKVWWDGTFRDKPVDNGVVVYYIEFSFTNGNKRIYKGDLQIIR